MLYIFWQLLTPPLPPGVIYLKHALSNWEHATQCQGRMGSVICTLLRRCKVIATDKACLSLTQRSVKHRHSQKQADASLEHCFAEQRRMPSLQLESFPDQVTENIVCGWKCFKTSAFRLKAHLYNCNRLTTALNKRREDKIASPFSTAVV